MSLRLRFWLKNVSSAYIIQETAERELIEIMSSMLDRNAANCILVASKATEDQWGANLHCQSCQLDGLIAGQRPIWRGFDVKGPLIWPWRVSLRTLWRRQIYKRIEKLNLEHSKAGGSRQATGLTSSQRSLSSKANKESRLPGRPIL